MKLLIIGFYPQIYGFLSMQNLFGVHEKTKKLILDVEITC